MGGWVGTRSFSPETEVAEWPNKLINIDTYLSLLILETYALTLTRVLALCSTRKFHFSSLFLQRKVNFPAPRRALQVPTI